MTQTRRNYKKELEQQSVILDKMLTDTQKSQKDAEYQRAKAIDAEKKADMYKAGLQVISRTSMWKEIVEYTTQAVDDRPLLSDGEMMIALSSVIATAKTTLEIIK